MHSHSTALPSSLATSHASAAPHVSTQPNHSSPAQPYVFDVRVEVSNFVKRAAATPMATQLTNLVTGAASSPYVVRANNVVSTVTVDNGKKELGRSKDSIAAGMSQMADGAGACLRGLKVGFMGVVTLTAAKVKDVAVAAVIVSSQIIANSPLAQGTANRAINVINQAGNYILPKLPIKLKAS